MPFKISAEAAGRYFTSQIIKKQKLSDSTFFLALVLNQFSR
jgi:hypothetical protein